MPRFRCCPLLLASLAMSIELVTADAYHRTTEESAILLLQVATNTSSPGKRLTARAKSKVTAFRRGQFSLDSFFAASSSGNTSMIMLTIVISIVVVSFVYLFLGVSSSGGPSYSRPAKRLGRSDHGALERTITPDKDALARATTPDKDSFTRAVTPDKILESEGSMLIQVYFAASGILLGLVVHFVYGILTPLAVACVFAILLGAFFPTALGMPGQSVPFDMLTVSTVAAAILGACGGKGLISAAILGVRGVPLVPYHCLAMFFGAAYLCLTLEGTGLLRVVAGSLVTQMNGFPKVLYSVIAVLAGSLTMVIPDDIVTMAFTPALCDAARRVGINPYPFVFVQFFAANSLSIGLITGNPTNVLVAEAVHVGEQPRSLQFMDFAIFCSGPAAIAATACAIIVYFQFRAELDAAAETPSAIQDFELTASRTKTALFAGRLGIALVLCMFDWATGVDAWLVVFAIGTLSMVMDILLDVCLGSNLASHTLREFPWELFPFLTALFLAVQCFDEDGGIDAISRNLGKFEASPPVLALVIGTMSLIVCQLMSAVPMSLLFIRCIIGVHAWTPEMQSAALLAVVVSSNLGAIGTPVGSLGSQMFCRILHDKGFAVNAIEFTSRGMPVMFIASAASLLSLGLWLPHAYEKVGPSTALRVFFESEMGL